MSGERLTLAAGDAVALSAGCLCSVSNATDAGRFESTWIVFHDTVLAKADPTVPHAIPLRGAALLRAATFEFIPAFDRAVQSLAEPNTIPSSVATHRMHELLAWLARTKVTFDRRRPADGPAGALDDRHCAESGLEGRRVAAAPAMSEATLRRRLTESGHSFNELLIDVRMTAALTLLQVTDRPVADIAFQVDTRRPRGSRRGSSRRFGLSPALVEGGSAA